MVSLVEGGEVVEDAAAQLARHAGRIRQVKDRLPFAPETDALILRRQEAAAPVVVVEELAARLALVRRGHHHEGRQVAGHAAQAVSGPGAHARPAGNLAAGHEEGNPGGVVDGLRVHRPDQAEVVGHRADVRQERRQFHPALAVRANGLMAGRIGKLAWPDVIVDSRVPSRTEAGSSCRRRAARPGLWSKRSTCEGAPPCHRTTTRLALGAQCGRPGRGAVSEPAGAAPARPSCRRSVARAATPMPVGAPAEPVVGTSQGHCSQQDCDKSRSNDSLKR